MRVSHSRNGQHRGNGDTQSQALVLLSGGLDSATCLFWAKQRFDVVHAITFNYSGRLEKEKQATELLARAARVSKILSVDLPFLKEMSDIDAAGSRRLRSGTDSRWSSYVPARNMIFYSIAAYHAESLGINSIVGGHNLHDSTFFKDSSPHFFEKLNSLFEQGCLYCNGKTYAVVLPLAGMTRQTIIKLAMQLSVPVDLTWSCHEDGKIPCGKCYACLERAEAFEALRVPDPALVLRRRSRPGRA